MISELFSKFIDLSFIYYPSASLPISTSSVQSVRSFSIKISKFLSKLSICNFNCCVVSVPRRRGGHSFSGDKPKTQQPNSDGRMQEMILPLEENKQFKFWNFRFGFIMDKINVIKTWISKWYCIKYNSTHYITM